MKRLVTGIVAVLAVGLVGTSAQAERRDDWHQVANMPNCSVWDPNYTNSGTVTWSGECVNNTAHGYGKLVWREKDNSENLIYIGPLRKGKKHGRGTNTPTNGKTYQVTYVFGIQSSAIGETIYENNYVVCATLETAIELAEILDFAETFLTHLTNDEFFKTVPGQRYTEIGDYCTRVRVGELTPVAMLFRGKTKTIKELGFRRNVFSAQLKSLSGSERLNWVISEVEFPNATPTWTGDE